MPRQPSLWSKDFATVPAPARRAARYALQLIRGHGGVQTLLQNRHLLGALWQVTMPLLDPEAVADLSDGAHRRQRHPRLARRRGRPLHAT